jgi:hypothetical protein
MKHFKKSSSKFLNELNKFFKNKYVLYVLVALSLIYLFILLTSSNFYAIYFFILLGIIIYCYTKNMAILLSVCILFTAIIFPLKPKEGMTTTKPTEGLTDQEKATVSSLETNMSTKKKPVKPTTTTPTTTTDTTDTTTPAPTTATTKASDSFTGQLAGQSRLDPALTMEKAFANLEGVLGSEGITNLSTDTSKLISNQEKLFKTIENMTPLIEKASTIMNKIGGF